MEPAESPKDVNEKLEIHITTTRTSITSTRTTETTKRISIVRYGATTYTHFYCQTEVTDVIQRVVKVRLFYLQDKLRPEAEKLKELFLKPPGSDNYYEAARLKLFSSH